MIKSIRTVLAALALSAGFAAPGLSQELPAPSGDVILTVSGALGVTNVDDTAQFDLEMLEALDATEIETTTIWTEGLQTFQGVSLHLLVDALDITGGTLRATAINDYAIEIPLSDAVEGGPILAYRNNGEEMSVRDKGPLWIIYPYDSSADFRTEVVYSRSIWQLDRIVSVE